MTSAYDSLSPEDRAALKQAGYRLKRTPMRRVPFGAKRREMVQTEKSFYPTIERLLLLHGCDFWRCESNQRSQPGFPDYEIYGDGWHSWLEVKARSLATGRAGKLSQAQLRYKASIERANGDYWDYLLPDEWPALEDKLCAMTGKDIRGTWRA